ncbi:flagellar basal body protein FliL [Sphingomonas oleivorans]|uniref:Flagellar protein FliL n=1 Tax=Sphingomonas oleivorans TaxID=1735121 RepID=A0A2T5FYC7_9SPHN|nr:flagellar basal body-associated FliL family protein [Sphingomonas oleivorans]PTQ11543.1 flagellar basal body protein FliL [Sphingomonas oleivorans]
MSDATAAPAPKKGGKFKTIIIYGVGALVLLGGGVGGGIYAAGSGLVGSKAKHEESNKPRLVMKGEEGHEVPKIEESSAPDPSRFRATYYPMEQSFTSNLRDSDGFVQIGLGVSTYYDERVIENLKRNDMPVRSAVLMTLADQDSESITTNQGKKALQAALKKSINDVLKAKEGFGGIEDVYFTSFIIQ